jgi:molybdopterin-guanine dinucleotide biosynthesis protein A
MNRHNQVAAFILAGGASSRMGEDKGLLEISGDPLAVRTASLVEPLVAIVEIVGNLAKFGGFGIANIPDQEFCTRSAKERSPGPLAGIATALGATSLPWNLVLACDLPYLTREWLAWLLQWPVASGTEAVVPRTSRGLEPLAALYHRDCRASMVAALAHGVRKITEALRDLHFEIVDEREWRHIDASGRVLRNMNTPEDYAEALKWHEARATRPRASVKQKMKRRVVPHRNKR